MIPGEEKYLEQAVLHTVHYFNIMGLPVTATQVWRALLVPDPAAPVRWEGHRAFSLPDVQAILHNSTYLRQHLATQWGYYVQRGREKLITEHLRRHVIAQHKWKKVRRATRFLTWVPFLEMLAVSGSLAMYNTKPGSDLDIFVIARAGRIWTVRLLVLLVAQLLGQRRKHWDQEAPDKLCFNHYITTDALAIAPQIRNEYTATLYTHLVPLHGHEMHRQFMAENLSWLRRFVMYQDVPPITSAHVRALPRGQRRFVRQLESLLLEPIGDTIERIVGSWQQRTIRRHTYPGQSGRITVSARELAFHPHSKVDGILRQLAQDTGQKRLW